MDYKSIYENTFSNESYSSELHIQYDYIVDKIKNMNCNTLIDIGSGRGHLINLLYKNTSNLLITSVDLKKFHSYDVNKFINCDLSNSKDREQLLENTYDVLVCTDVFEHLDKTFIEDVIIMCSKLSRNCIFGIANHSDVWNGIELHTIQENDTWWDSIIKKYFNITNKDVMFNGRLYMYTCTSL